jgi:hypothetical protein
LGNGSEVVVEVVLQLVFFVLYLDGIVSINSELLHFGEGHISQRRLFLNLPPQPLDLLCPFFELLEEGGDRILRFYFFLEVVAAVNTHDGVLKGFLGDAGLSSLSGHGEERDRYDGEDGRCF